MQQDLFFTNIINHYDKTLPFVMYRKPNTGEVKAILQSDNRIYKTEEFTESGFVFSPFNTEEDSIIIPLNTSKVITCLYKDEVLSNPGAIVLQSNTGKAEETTHVKLVADAVSAITKEAGFEKVVISRKEEIKMGEINPISLFKKLLQSYKTAFVYCWYHPKIGLWLGATPETLLKMQGNQLSTMALAGTQKFKGTIDVIWEEKEVVEQQLVTDFIVEQLKTTLVSLSVGKTQTIKAGDLLHIKTELRGVIQTKSKSLKSVLQGLHPTPAVCGMPKAKAKRFILNNENYNRGFYTGFLGELNFKEKTTRNTNRRNVENNAYNGIKKVSNLFVNLRCMQCVNDTVILYVGGGITKDSIPEKEWEETVNKTTTVKNIL